MQTGSWLPGWGLGVGTTSRGPASQASQNQDAAPSATDPEFPLGCHLSSVVNRVKAPKEVHILVPRTCAHTHTHTRYLRGQRDFAKGIKDRETGRLSWGQGHREVGDAVLWGWRRGLEPRNADPSGSWRSKDTDSLLEPPEERNQPCPHLVLSQQDPSQTPEQQDNTVWFPEASRVG